MRTAVGEIDWLVGKDAAGKDIWVMNTDREQFGATHKRIRQKLKPDDLISLGFAIMFEGKLERAFTDPARADSRYEMMPGGLCEPVQTVDLAKDRAREVWTFQVTPDPVTPA